MNLIQAFAYAGKFPGQFVFCVILALIPSLAWITIFYRKHHEKKAIIALNFVLGMLSAAIVLAYQYFWGQKLNLGFFMLEPLNFQKNIQEHFAHPLFSMFLIYLSIGFMEEFSKHWVMKKADKKFFRSVDDVIELAIVVALGFAFLENIGYFFRQIIVANGQSIFGIFIIRSTLIVFIHVLCSGIYGYFWGIGYFAKPIMKDEKREGKRFFIPEILHRLFHFKRSRVFHDEMVSLGLIISVLAHGVYDFAVAMEASVGELLGIAFLNDLHTYHIIAPAMLIFGFYGLSRLLENKEDQKIFGRRVVVEKFK